jgi:LysR family hydrogen peroxide-inducible transcriptional activator
LVLSETLNFGRAATRSNTSQPALSFLIKSMESEIGTELFKRDKRHVELTAAGTQLVGVAKSILSRVRGYEESIKSLSIGRSLRIFCSQAGEQHILPATLRYLTKRVPDWNIEFCNIWPIEYVTALRENRVDVLLMVRPLEAPGITFLPIARESWRAVVPAHSPAAKRGSISMRSLANSPLLVPGKPYCDWYRPRLEELFRSFGVHPEIIDCPLSLSARFALVAGGKGNVICTESQAPPSSSTLKTVQIEEHLPSYERGAAWRSSFDPSALSIFKHALSEALDSKLAS